ncbi:MAG: WD40 repeat domain-containing protein [Candidatus Fervidibacter sp.]|uniref:WD40 repeat domain-containing protein n=1 Tax=Candidatus Fervidibacter sp. TaxID=3100871 RepID=UPI0040494E9A
MNKEKWLNRIVFVVAIVGLALWARWLFHPRLTSFVLKARWKVKGLVISTAFSPDSNLLAVLVNEANFPKVNLWRVSEGQETGQTIVVSETSGRIWSERQLAFSPDGRFLAVGYSERGLAKIAIFRVSDGRKVQTITMGKTNSVPSVAFLPDGRLAVNDYQLWFVRISDGEKVKSSIVVPTAEVTLSPDGRFIAAIHFGTIKIYDSKERLVQQINLSKMVRASHFTI